MHAIRDKRASKWKPGAPKANFRMNWLPVQRTRQDQTGARHPAPFGQIYRTLRKTHNPGRTGWTCARVQCVTGYVLEALAATSLNGSKWQFKKTYGRVSALWRDTRGTQHFRPAAVTKKPPVALWTSEEDSFMFYTLQSVRICLVMRTYRYYCTSCWTDMCSSSRPCLWTMCLIRYHNGSPWKVEILKLKKKKKKKL